jgi:hypothetical protein
MSAVSAAPVSLRAAKQRVEQELAAVLARDAELDAELRHLLGSSSSTSTSVARPGLEALSQRLAQVQQAQPEFRPLRSRGAALCAQISEGHAMAERVSGAVRSLDQQRARVQATLSLVEESIELKGCAEGVRVALAAGDLVRGVHHVRRYQQLDAAALANSSELSQVNTACCIGSNYCCIAAYVYSSEYVCLQH